MGLQFFALNTPFRVFHVIYLWAFGMIYVLNTYIAFKVNIKRDNPYSFLNWETGDGGWILASRF